MSEETTRLTRRNKVMLASLAIVSLSLGTAGIVSAQNTPTSGKTAPAGEEVDGVDCENGIDAATGAECDGGPSANPQDGADDAKEASEAAGK